MLNLPALCFRFRARDLLAALLVVLKAMLLTAGLLLSPLARAEGEVKVTDQYDSYAKVLISTTEKFKVPDVGSFFDPAFAHAWLTGYLSQGQLPAISLHVQFYRSNGWRFFDRALDSEGQSIPVTVTSRQLEGGSAISEQFYARLSTAYLESKRESGLDIRFDGKGGSLIVKLPKTWVTAMLANVQARQAKLAMPLHTASSVPSSAPSITPAQPSVQKLRLGIRHLTQAMVSKMPEASRPQLPASGLLIALVEPNSPAATAGFLVGDVLIGFANREIRTPEDMGAAMSTIADGSQVEAVVIRNGASVKLSVQL